MRMVAKWGSVAAAGVLVATLGGCGGGVSTHSGTKGTSPPTGPPYKVTGVLDLADSDSAANIDTDGGCSGSGGYSDISPAAEITVTNQAKTIIGTAQLGEGEPRSSDGAQTDCIFHFVVSDLPKANFYTFAIGTRGGVTYSAAQMTTGKWGVSLTLGG